MEYAPARREPGPHQTANGRSAPRPDLSWLLTKEAWFRRSCRAAAIERRRDRLPSPVTAAEVEEIRGVVMSKGTFDVLMETGWIKPRGREGAGPADHLRHSEELPSRHFGLEVLGDLPGLEELKAQGFSTTALRGLRGADAVRRPGAAHRRGPAGAGRSRPRPRAGRRRYRGIRRDFSAVIPGARGASEPGI